jgi:hypothetical protein
VSITNWNAKFISVGSLVIQHGKIGIKNTSIKHNLMLEHHNKTTSGDNWWGKNILKNIFELLTEK